MSATLIGGLFVTDVAVRLDSQSAIHAIQSS